MSSRVDAERLRRNDKQLTYLQLLRPGTDTSLSALNDLTEALAHNTSLNHARMFIPRDFFGNNDGMQIDEEDLRLRRLLFQRIGSLPQLEQLKVDSFTGVVSFPVDVLHKTLCHARHLKELELWDLQLTVNDANSAMDFERLKLSLQGHPTLQKFTLYNCQLKGGDMCTLDPLLCALATASKLKQVYITAAAAVSSFSPSVAFSSSVLEHLCHSTSLQELGLWKFEFPKTQEQQNIEPLCLMAPAIAQSNTLKTLQFGRCEISKASDEALGQMLLENTALEELDVHLNSSKASSLIATARALESNKTLKQLKLGPLSRENQLALVHMVRNNYVLETCRLLDADDDLSAMIDFYISLNRKSRQQLLMNEKTIGDWVEFFAKDAGRDLSTIFYYLSMRPGMCCLE